MGIDYDDLLNKLVHFILRVLVWLRGGAVFEGLATIC